MFNCGLSIIFNEWILLLLLLLNRLKTLDDPRVRVISPVGKEKVYGGKDLLKSQVLSSEWNTERVREDASGDSEDGEDDEQPCVIGKSAGDCVWRGSLRSVGEFVPQTRCSIGLPKRAVCDCQRKLGRWASKSEHRLSTCVVTRLIPPDDPGAGKICWITLVQTVLYFYACRSRLKV